MKSKDIKKIIANVEASKKTTFSLRLEKTVFINMPKGKVLFYLKQDYANSLCIELKEEMKAAKVTGKEIGEKIGINKVEFSYLINGKYQSCQHIKDREEFYKLSKNAIKELC